MNENVLIGIGLIILALVLAFLGAWIGMALWNSLMVGVFGLPVLTFWQFYGLMVLIHILFPSSNIRRDRKDK